MQSNLHCSTIYISEDISSVQFSSSVVSGSLQPYESQRRYGSNLNVYQQRNE